MAEQEKEQLPEALTAKKRDFSRWYGEILYIAGIIDKRYDVKGMNVWTPFGFSIMNNIKELWDKEFKENDFLETYFPLLVPRKYAEINDSWFEGFKKEAFWVISGAEKKPGYILRPTGEPAMYPMFKLWLRTYSDLPIKIYETVSSFRYETKHTRPLIRDREIPFWYEIHTAFATREEAEKDIVVHLKMLTSVWKGCGLYPVRVNKPKWECFPGAIGAVEDYTVMPTGKAMENGSFNKLGQAYSKKFDLKFKTKNGKEDYAWMNCTGNGARILAAVIATHGDDKGLVLPPAIAPVQIIIIPIFSKKDKVKVLKYCEKIMEKLKGFSFRVGLDDSNENVGRKFYDSEIKGIPIRLEIGSKDMSKKKITFYRRDEDKKKIVSEGRIYIYIKKALSDIQEKMYKFSKKFTKKNIEFVSELNKIPKVVENGKVISCFWCLGEKCYDKIRELQEGLDPFGTDYYSKKEGKCICCSKKTKDLLYVANTY